MAKSKEATQSIPEDTEGDTGELTTEGIDALLDDNDDSGEQEALATEEVETPPAETGEVPAETSGEVEVEAAVPAEGDTAEAEAAPEVPEETPPVEPQAEEEAPPAVAEEEPPVEAAPETTPEQWQEWRDGAIGRLAGRYTFSEAEAEAFQENPAEELPKLAAKVTFDAVQMTTQAIMSHLPAAIAQVQQSNSAAELAEGNFYAAWPDLDRTKHGSTVQKLAATYRMAYPNASAADVITHVGAQAIIALKITPANIAGSEDTPPARTPPTPPAAAAGGAGPITEAKPKNAFDLLAEGMDEEDAVY